MKKYLFIASAALLVACGQTQNNHAENTATDSSATAQTQVQYFGELITADSAVTFEEMKTAMGTNKEMNVKVTAPIDAVCQKKGCWMDVKAADGSTMRVTFKDYGFFVPKDASGKQAIMQGVAKIEETSVADQQEYLKDAGKSKEEIAAVKEPKKELVFEANGVIIQ